MTKISKETFNVGKHELVVTAKFKDNTLKVRVKTSEGIKLVGANVEEIPTLDDAMGIVEMVKLDMLMKATEVLPLVDIAETLGKILGIEEIEKEISEMVGAE